MPAGGVTGPEGGVPKSPRMVPKKRQTGKSGARKFSEGGEGASVGKVSSIAMPAIQDLTINEAERILDGKPGSYLFSKSDEGHIILSVNYPKEGIMHHSFRESFVESVLKEGPRPSDEKSKKDWMTLRQLKDKKFEEVSPQNILKRITPLKIRSFRYDNISDERVRKDLESEPIGTWAIRPRKKTGESEEETGYTILIRRYGGYESHAVDFGSEIPQNVFDRMKFYIDESKLTRKF